MPERTGQRHSGPWSLHMNVLKNAGFQAFKSKIWAAQARKFDGLVGDVSPVSQDLCRAVRHQVSDGGKRLRALIPVWVAQQLSSEQCSTDELASSEWLGLAVELLHSASKCHDDIMDGDKVRNGLPTVWMNFGQDQAITAGDLLIILANQAILRSGLRPEQIVLAFQCLSDLMAVTAYGQSYENMLRRDQSLPTQQDYERVVTGKTGGMFALTLMFGGIAANCPAGTLQQLKDLGLALGTVFQIQDDLIDLLGDKGRDVKGSDLWEGKPSWLVAFAAARLSEDDREGLRKRLFIPRVAKKESDVAFVLQLLEKSGALEAGHDYLRNLPRLKEALQESYPDLRELAGELLEMIQAPVDPPLIVQAAQQGSISRGQ